ncbi:unnamed protein product [Lactuca virosa]|uniref:Uncharacterized protein n=1 Tax=Lactuca virosa TaxID=75947 RepID=A0AAU9LG11_9ASTR|nr:unnamed protein product [Lactuca virosa]
MEYLETINPDDGSGKLLPKETVGPSKKSRKSKKDVIITPEKPVQEPKKTKSPKQTKPNAQVSTVVVEPVEPVVDTQEKETLPSKLDIFRRVKKKSRRSRKLSDGSFKSSSMVCKPYLNHQGILIR